MFNVFQVLTGLTIFLSIFNQPTTPLEDVTPDVQGESIKEQITHTPTPTVTSTPSPTAQLTPTPTRIPTPTRQIIKQVTPTTKPTIYVQPTTPPVQSQSGLDNDNYYVNSQGNTVHSPANSVDGNVPSGATARCEDGTYSFSQSRRGTCSGHGGVSQWL